MSRIACTVGVILWGEQRRGATRWFPRVDVAVPEREVVPDSGPVGALPGLLRDSEGLRCVSTVEPTTAFAGVQ
jgi:hypothetical protein